MTKVGELFPLRSPIGGDSCRVKTRCLSGINNMRRMRNVASEVLIPLAGWLGFCYGRHPIHWAGKSFSVYLLLGNETIKMRTENGFRRFLLLCSLALPALSGCAELGLQAMNPWVQRRWAQEEKQYGKTLLSRAEEIRDLRRQASRLSPSEREQASQNLVAILKNEKNVPLRIEATKALGAFATPAATAALRAAQADGNSKIRIAACQAWEQRGDGEAVNSLAAIIGSDTDVDVRLAAARGLGKFQNPTAVRALGTALDDSNNPQLQYRAVESLKTASGRDYGSNLTAWRQYAQGEDPGPQQNVRWADGLRKLF